MVHSSRRWATLVADRVRTESGNVNAAAYRRTVEVADGHVDAHRIELRDRAAPTIRTAVTVDGMLDAREHQRLAIADELDAIEPVQRECAQDFGHQIGRPAVAKVCIGEAPAFEVELGIARVGFVIAIAQPAGERVVVV